MCLLLAEKSWVLLEKLEKKKKKISKKMGERRIGGLASNLDGPPFFLAAIKSAICVRHFKPISRIQRLLQYKL